MPTQEGCVRNLCPSLGSTEGEGKWEDPSETDNPQKEIWGKSENIMEEGITYQEEETWN